MVYLNLERQQAFVAEGSRAFVIPACDEDDGGWQRDGGTTEVTRDVKAQICRQVQNSWVSRFDLSSIKKSALRHDL